MRATYYGGSALGGRSTGAGDSSDLSQVFDSYRTGVKALCTRKFERLSMRSLMKR
jgi:hypothetical protein